jgi:glycosyltransferase involved in cell wall biosynthesis
MNVLMICGSYPPDVCGVGDYTAQLVQSLKQIGISVDTLHRMRWNSDAVNEIRQIIAQHQYNLVHIQYPSVGYGKSLAPQILSLRVPAVVTLHEFSHVRIPRRLSSLPFLFSARHLLFTSQYELENIQRFAPWISGKSSVIPIGTNILPAQSMGRRRFDEVIYFGLISPRKGIEKVLEFASIAGREQAPITVRIIGRIPLGFREYAKKLIADARDLPVVWTLDESESQVAEHLAKASVAYFPFPDGASDRRGSLKAALAAGVVCISTEGKQLSSQLRSLLTIAAGSEDAMVKAMDLLSNENTWEKVSAAGRAHSESFRWDQIALKHLELYEKLSCEEGRVVG